MTRYRIVRHFFQSGRKRVIRKGLTFEQARAHCADPETSSETCRGAEGTRLARRSGPWFDGWEPER